MISEFDLIAHIASIFDTPEGVTLGIGDDGAVLDPGRFDLVTADTLVEGVHFDRNYSSAEDIGWKALATNLSDVAAMGGGPGVFILSLCIPADEDFAFLQGILQGMKQACDELVPDSFQVSVGGGDVTRIDGPLVISITLLGESSPAGPVLRRGAVPGDRVILLGAVGMSAAGLAILSGEVEVDGADYPSLLQAHRRPMPRVHAGAMLGLHGIPSSLIDISDGLAQDLQHILTSSRVGAAIETHGLPRHPELVALHEATGVDLLPWMLSGGDDYELLMTVPPARMPKLWELARRYQWDVYDIGEVRDRNEGLRLLDPRGELIKLSKSGYRHFEEGGEPE
ncbi:MAG: thiamine-phosphate kinase [Myxococcota bacterium]|jgi:thiamine-monophosphate kinase|nr:thiamine-phosphate kinase [Myxococcota bacterium]